MAEIRVGAVAVELVVTVTDDITGAAVDVSTATEKTIYLIPPGFGQTPIKLDAVNDTDGVNGKIKYVTRGVTFDLNKSGDWSIEGFVALADGSQFPTDPTQFTVAPSARYPGL
jgi:hypothetical protein